MKTSINILSPHLVMLKNYDQHRGRFVWGCFDRQTWGRFGHTPRTFWFWDVLTGHREMNIAQREADCGGNTFHNPIDCTTE